MYTELNYRQATDQYVLEQSKVQKYSSIPIGWVSLSVTKKGHDEKNVIELKRFHV